MKILLTKFIKTQRNYLKWLFKKPEISFNRKLRVEDIVEIIKRGDLYEMRNLLPSFSVGQRKLSRSQSLLFLGLAGLIGLGISIYLKNPLPLLFFSIIAYGSEYEISSSSVDWISCSVLDATHFVVAYNIGHLGKAKIGVISGNTITYGSEYEFSSYADWISCSALDATHFVVAYQEGANKGYGKIGVVSGDTIAFGSSYKIDLYAIPTWISVSALDATHFVVAYSRGTPSEAVIGVVSGDTIAYGSSYEISTGSPLYNSVSSLDATHFVAAYKRSDTYGHCKIGVVSGNVITYGSEYIFNSTTTYHVSALSLDSTHFVIAYKDSGGDTYGHCKIGTITGSDIAYGSEYVFNSAITDIISCSSISSTSFVVCYDDNSVSGQSIIGDYSVSGGVHFKVMASQGGL